MDKSNDWPGINKNCEQEEYRGDGYKLADKTRA